MIRLLIDQNLPVDAAAKLRNAGYDVVHTRDRGWQRASDKELLESAREEGRVIVTQDLDFSRLMAESGLQHPSAILLRERGLLPDEVFQRVRDVGQLYGDQLDAGCLVTVDRSSVRLRILPVL